MFGACRADYGAVHLWRGRWTEAEALLIDSAEDFSHSRPAMVGGPAGRLRGVEAAAGTVGRRQRSCSTKPDHPRSRCYVVSA